MRWLRSRWTIVALVPAFFLAGFGIVSALAGGSDGPETSAAQGSTTEASGPGTVTIQGETDPADASIGPGSTPTTGDGGGGAGGETTTDGANGGGNGGGAPPAPAPGTIAIDYGRWDGIFEIANPEIVPDFGLATVVGGFQYLGGVECGVGLVRVKVWFFNEKGNRVGTTVWDSVQSTGDGAEVTGREPLPFEAYGSTSEGPTSAALRLTAVECL